MTRIAIEEGGWFDPDKAESWDEGDYFDGANWISKATHSQWEHERLYRTRTGRWILERHSNWQGTEDTYEEITDSDAAAWLMRNEIEPPAELADTYAASEI